MDEFIITETVKFGHYGCRIVEFDVVEIISAIPVEMLE